MDFLSLLPDDMIHLLIIQYPKRCWFLLNKRLNKVASDIIDPSKDNNKAIRIAAEKGATSIVISLLYNKRVNPCVNDNEPLWIAAANGHKEVVETLLKDARVDPHAGNDRAIRWAASREIAALIRSK
jgi:ankyrin repeat protein